MENRISAPLFVRTFGFIQNVPYHSTPGTKQGDVMLTLFLKGAGRYEREGSAIPLREGTIGLVGPEEGGILLCDPENPYAHYYVRFCGEYARRLAKRIKADRGTNFFSDPMCREYAKRLGEFPTVRQRRPSDKMDDLGVAVLGILVNLLQKKTAAASPLDNCENLVIYLQDRIAKPSCLDEMAEELNVSRSTLTKRCRALSGKSVQQLHEELKMEWAVELLRSGNIRITEIANRLGYRDALYFSKVFKKHYRRSPKHYASESENP